MTFTNVLESQIKFLIYVESKAGSGTTLCLIMQTIKSSQIESEKPLQCIIYQGSVDCEVKVWWYRADLGTYEGVVLFH